MQATFSFVLGTTATDRRLAAPSPAPPRTTVEVGLRLGVGEAVVPQEPLLAPPPPPPLFLQHLLLA